MSTGKIGLSVGTIKIANKYEIFTEEEVDIINNKIPELDGRVGDIEEEVDIINNKIPELDGRVGDIEEEIEEINSSLDNVTNLTNKRVEVSNEKDDVKGVIDLANYAGQGTTTKDIMCKVHNYTDSDVMWLDNVGEGNTILRLNNSRNPIRREDKGNDYVGSGTYLQCGKHATDGSKYYLMFELDKDGNINWDGQRAASTIFTNFKGNVTNVPAFIFRTPSSRHDKIATFQTSHDNREVISIGVQGSGSLAEIDLGEKMSAGLVFNLPSGATLQSGIGGNIRTIPNVRVQNYAPTSIAPEFIGQIFINTGQASQGLKPSVYIAWGTSIGNWVALD